MNEDLKMGTLLESLLVMQNWLFFIGIAGLIFYRFSESYWGVRLLIGVVILLFATASFTSAEVIQLISEVKYDSKPNSVTINTIKFTSSVIWAAISVGLILHSVTFSTSKVNND